MGDIQDWQRVVGIYRRLAARQKTEIHFYRTVIVGLLIVVTLLTGCTTQHTGVRTTDDALRAVRDFMRPTPPTQGQKEG